MPVQRKSRSKEKRAILADTQVIDNTTRLQNTQVIENKVIIDDTQRIPKGIHNQHPRLITILQIKTIPT